MSQERPLIQTYRVVVKDKRGEWGEFQVSERRPTLRRSSGGLRYSVTWTCDSSYGVFGYHWLDMGEPFDRFVANISNDYLLSKIGRRVTDDRKMAAGVKKSILERRRDRRIDATQAREALDALASLDAEHSGEVLAHQIYCSDFVSDCGLDLTEIDTLEWDASSRMFVERLWPLFVRKVVAIYRRHNASLQAFRRRSSRSYRG